MNKMDPLDIKKNFVHDLDFLFSTIDELVKDAGSLEDFNYFNKRLLEYRVADINMKLGPKDNEPVWPCTLELKNKLILAIALYYICCVYDFSYTNLEDTFLEELEHADKAKEEKINYTFLLRFYNDNGSIGLEASTLLESSEYKNVENISSNRKDVIINSTKKSIAKIASIKRSSSKWDKDLISELKK